MVTHNQVIPQPCRFLATGAEDGPLGSCARRPGDFYRAITHAASVPNKPSAVKRRLLVPGQSSVAKAVGTQPVSLVERVAMRIPLTPGPAAQSAPMYGALVGDARCVVGAQPGCMMMTSTSVTCADHLRIAIHRPHTVSSFSNAQNANLFRCLFRLPIPTKGLEYDPLTIPNICVCRIYL
jgi:hypothetical protein